MYNSSGRSRAQSERPRTEGERPRRRHRKRHSPIKTFFKVLGTLALVGITTGALLCCFAAIYIKTSIIPNATLDLSKFHIGLNSVLYYTDENGVERELRTLHGDENRVWVPYDQIPQDLINATVAIEDKRFWTHKGVDWKRTAAAVLYMFTGRSIQGGSTITQQLIKNVTGENETTVKRKVKEIFTALYVDEAYGKKTTLEWYLNRIYLGRGCYGVYTASYMYFGKHLDELTVAEYASLISITNNPSLYDPYVYPENNERRKNNVLRVMYEEGYLNEEEYEEAKNQELVFASKPVQIEKDSTADSSGVYSWYEEQVITDVTTDLANGLGIAWDVAYDMVLEGGLKIYTCIDPRVQQIAESIYENPDNFNYPSKSGQELQSAITIIDNTTGDVAAIVGQVGVKTGDRWRNNATTAQRQPGSSIKPLAVYAPALDMGLITPLTGVDDYPYELSGTRAYPQNANGYYNGLTTIYYGLTNSINTIAFRVLSDMVTPAASFNFVQDKLHIDLVEARQVGNQIKSDLDRAPLSMGGLTDGVNTRDMAEAYASFPNHGIYRTSRTYTRVLDNEGNVLLENESLHEAAMKESTAYYINTMLSNAVAVGTGTEARIKGMHVAGKTGSTSSYCDRWFAGYTPYYTAVVWTGHPIMERVRSGSSNPAAATWQKVMSLVHEGLEDKEFFTVNNLVSVTYCRDSGLIATDACRNDPRGSRASTLSVLREDAPREFCNIHSAESQVVVCRDCPILDDKGAETGLYHLAGEFCPEESRMTVNLLDYQREQIGTAVARDEKYTLHYTQEQGPCTVHTEAPVPEDPGPPEDPPNPDDPSWPYNPDNPLVNPIDPGQDPTVTNPYGNEPYVPAA